MAVAFGAEGEVIAAVNAHFNVRPRRAWALRASCPFWAERPVLQGATTGRLVESQI